MLKRKNPSAKDLERGIKKLKRKNQDAKEVEIQLKKISSCKDNEIAKYNQWLTEERRYLNRKLSQRESQVNSLSKENFSLKNELADCQSKWDRDEKKLAKKREKLEIERRTHLDAVDATARWYKKVLEKWRK